MQLDKIRTLGKLYMKIETRGRDGSRRKMILIFISYLFPGIFLPLLLFKQYTEPTGFEFAFLTFLFYSMLIAFTAVSEFDNLIISNTEAEVISSLPLDDELLVNAKLFVVLRYVFYVSLPLLVPGSVFFYFVLGSGVRALLYFISGYMLCLFTVNILLLLYGAAMRNFKPQRLGTYTLILQVILIFFLIIGYQFVSYAFTNRVNTGIAGYFDMLRKNNYILLFPQSWYGYIPVKKNAAFDYHLALKVFLPVFICYMSYLGLKYYLEENYKYIREKYLYSRTIFKEDNIYRQSEYFPGFLGKLSSLYLRDHIELASFNLMRSSFRLDKTVRLNIIPMLAIPVGLAIFALITDQLQSPFIQVYLMTRPVFHITIFLSVLIVLNMAILGIKITSDSGASWVYESFPVISRKLFLNGVRKFFVVYLLLPVCFLLFLFFLFKMPVFEALIHALFILGSALLFNSIFHLFTKTLPFTKENTIYNSVQRITSIIFPFIFGLIFIAIQSFVYKSILAACLAVLSLYFINYWIVFFGFGKSSIAKAK